MTAQERIEKLTEALKEILGSCDGDLCADQRHHEIAREVLAETSASEPKLNADHRAGCTFPWTGCGCGFPSAPSKERDYTPEEALAEAKRRWGSTGVAIFMSDNSPESRYVVGSHTGLMRWGVMGEGITFRTAFAAADSQGGKKDE